jgi:hypothetical protein
MAVALPGFATDGFALAAASNLARLAFARSCAANLSAIFDG